MYQSENESKMIISALVACVLVESGSALLSTVVRYKTFLLLRKTAFLYYSYINIIFLRFLQSILYLLHKSKNKREYLLMYLLHVIR